MKIDLRIRCLLWGCWCDRNHACPKCGCALYDVDFIQKGKLRWLQSLWWNLKRFSKVFSTRHCEVCGKRLRFAFRAPCCSEKCLKEWLPF